MPARILIQSRGFSQGDYLISEEVLRIGSDANCHLVVSGISPHALTLRFDSGRYTIYNRSGQTITLESDSIEANGHAHWKPGDDLAVDRDTILTLRVEGDPAPSRPTESSIASGYLSDLPPEEVETASPIQSEEEPVSRPDQTAFYLQLLFIIVCFVAAGAMMFIDQAGLMVSGEPRKSAAEIQAEFDDLISRISEQIDVQAATRDEWLHLRITLQDARALQLRKQASEASDAYRKVRTIVSRYRDPVRGTFLESEAGQLAGEIDKFAADQSNSLSTLT